MKSAAIFAPALLSVPMKVTPLLMPLVSINTTGIPAARADSMTLAKAFGSVGAIAIAVTPLVI